MQVVLRRFPGLVLLLRLNADRLLSLGAVVVCLVAGAYLASVILRG
jgi:hypothetical protein